MSNDIPWKSDDSDDARMVDPSSPRVIRDRYHVIRVLGTGASAQTLLCTDLKEDRQVAVKELRFQHLDDWRHLDLFTREARVLAMLDHPGVPEVYEVLHDDETQTTLFLVQEFIDGASLATRMANGPLLGEQEVFDLAVGLLDVLDYLHSRTPPVLHRDIKPSNVLIRKGGDPVLIDFGGVCFGWRPPDHTGTTIVGTSGFMPPEQLLGQAGPTSDLYSLGATLLTLVTGIQPHEFPFETGRIEVPGDLPVRDPLRDLIEAVLRPAPRDRPRSAAAARTILRGEIAGSGHSLQEVSVPVHTSGIRRTVPVVGSRGPSFVDLGPPPRDPNGDFADVWRNITSPLFPTRPTQDAPLRGYPSGLFSILSLITLGVIPLLYGIKVRKRERRYESLFRSGEFTRGWVVSVNRGDIFGTCTYDFDVGSVTYRGIMEYSTNLCRFWNEGDTVPVLYESGNPRDSCLVFR